MIKIINKIFEGDVLGKSRKIENVYARIAYANFMANEGESPAFIGRKIKKKRETIIYYCKQHIQMYEYEKAYKRKYDIILEENQNN